VNSPQFSPESRIPDPQRLIQAHACSSMTMNFVRALVDGGFADLHHPEYWDLSWVEHSPLAEEFRRLAEGIGRSVKFMETISGQRAGNVKRVDFYTSHEALHLHYEQALTRQVPRQEGWFNLSTHFPWLGMRTANLDDAHVEYFRGIRNPIGVKVGPGMGVDQLLRLITVLNPGADPGRLVLIHRMGADRILEKLPPMIAAVRETGMPVLWVCDPMHGNTETTGTRLGGVHLELTGENVTECTGGARDLGEKDLERFYKSTVDPRLNYEQALELAMLIVRKHNQPAE
jgi:3-deoxy-7-phosphoheptulonate synthase